MTYKDKASYDSKPLCITPFKGVCHTYNVYGVATISRLLKIIGLFCKEPYKRDDILQKGPIILRGLLIVATL